MRNSKLTGVQRANGIHCDVQASNVLASESSLQYCASFSMLCALQAQSCHSSSFHLVSIYLLLSFQSDFTLQSFWYVVLQHSGTRTHVFIKVTNIWSMLSAFHQVPAFHQVLCNETTPPLSYAGPTKQDTCFCELHFEKNCTTDRQKGKQVFLG